MDDKSLTSQMMEYAEQMIDGRVRVNNKRILAAKRFLRDLENDDYFINESNAAKCIQFIESTFRHVKGTERQKFLKLQDWQKFVIFNLVAFEYKDRPGIRRFNEAFIYLPRKNGKTFFASALAWALTFLTKSESANLYIVATKMDRAREAFNNIKKNIQWLGQSGEFKIRDNNAEHSIYRDFGADGEISIQALAADTEKADGLNGNIFILDEIHGYKSATDYFVYKEAMKAYQNKLLIGITTAGHDASSFCYGRLKYCKDILDGIVTDESYFVFICEADDLDAYTDPYQHEIANPSYGVSVYPQDLKNDAYQAEHDPFARADFLHKSLNCYTNSLDAYFNMEEFRESDNEYSWSLEELAELPITWYGGADLSMKHDLTGTALYGNYNGVDICITHAFFPKAEALRKQKEDNIELYGWVQDGNLTLINDKTMDFNVPVKWFMDMREMGFDIAQVGYDPRFGKDFIFLMEENGFYVKPTEQRPETKSQGFRHIEWKVKRKEFYYLHSEAYEYCVGNVKASENTNKLMQFSKISAKRRIDLFDASVFAAYEFLETDFINQMGKEWLDGNQDYFE